MSLVNIIFHWESCLIVSVNLSIIIANKKGSSDVIPSHYISVSWCMSCTSLTYFFATPDFLKHSHSSSLCTLLLIFSRSTKTEHLFLTFSVHLHQHFLLQLCASPLFRMSNAQEVANNPRATSQFLQASVICEILHFMTGQLEKDWKIAPGACRVFSDEDTVLVCGRSLRGLLYLETLLVENKMLFDYFGY